MMIYLFIIVVALVALHLTGYSKYILEHIPNTIDYKKKYVDYNNVIKAIENTDCTYFINLDKKFKSGIKDKSKFDKFADDVFNDDIKPKSRELFKKCMSDDIPLSKTEKKELLPYFEKIKNGFEKKDVESIIDVLLESKLFYKDHDIYFNRNDKKLNSKLKYLEKWLIDNGVVLDNITIRKAIISFQNINLYKRSIEYDFLIKSLKDNDCTSIHKYFKWIKNGTGLLREYGWFKDMVENKNFYLSNKLQKDTNMNLEQINKKILDCVKGKECEYWDSKKINTFANIEDTNVKIIDRPEDYDDKNDNLDYIFNLNGVCGYSLEKPCKSGYKFDNNSCQKID